MSTPIDPPAPTATRAEQKAHLLRELMSRGRLARVYLDPRRDGVVLPATLRGSPYVVLHYGLHLIVPIPDLVVDDRGISATLSFSRTPLATHVPWSAVFAIGEEAEEGDVYLWQVDAPPDLPAPDGQPAHVAEVVSVNPRAAADDAAARATREHLATGRHLRAVGDDEVPQPGDEAHRPPEQPEVVELGLPAPVRGWKPRLVS